MRIQETLNYLTFFVSLVAWLATGWLSMLAGLPFVIARLLADILCQVWHGLILPQSGSMACR